MLYARYAVTVALPYVALFATPIETATAELSVLEMTMFSIFCTEPAVGVRPVNVVVPLYVQAVFAVVALVVRYAVPP
jgi:hypothetical protein